MLFFEFKYNPKLKKSSSNKKTDLVLTFEKNQKRTVKGFQNTKKTFSVQIIDMYDQNMKTIKLIQKHTNKKTKEIKQLLSQLPAIFIADLTREDAKRIKNEFDSYGIFVKIL